MPIANICALAQLIIMQGVCAVKTGIFCITDALTNADAFAKLPKKIKVKDAGDKKHNERGLKFHKDF